MTCKPNADELSALCKSESKNLKSSDFDRIVHDYRENHEQDANRLLDYYSSLSSYQEAAEVIGLAELPSGKRHPHQRRLKSEVLQEVHKALLDAESRMGSCSSFEELFDTVRETIGEIWGVGELMVYDTANRLGAYFGLEPEAVYLHRGTREGAETIGIDSDRKKVEVSELPEPLQNLRPHELEDCLCIYKDELRRVAV
jgi:hypothetical protein